MQFNQNVLRRTVGRRGCAAAACCLLLAPIGGAWADTLSSESSVGLSSEYAGNPFLVSSGARAAEAVALLANLPATYTSDEQTIDVIARLREAQTHGDVQLISDYQYLDADWRLNGERNSLVTNLDWNRDSTFYNVYENAALLGHSLRRLEEEANLAWKHTLSELSDLQLVGSYDQLNYSRSAGSSVDDYRYSQASVQYDRTLSERWQWISSAGFGRYQLSNQAYSSDNRFVQSSVVRTLTERWSMTAQLGYSNVDARQQSLICCELVPTDGGYALQLIPVKQSSSRGSADYALSLERKTERLTLDFAASRAIQPSGLGALLTQDDASIKATELWTERLTVGANLHASRLSDPLQRLALGDRRSYDATLSVNWFWTEHWTVGWQATYVLQRISAQTPVGAGATVYLNLTRQFGRLRL